MMKKRFQEYDLKWEEAYHMTKNKQKKQPEMNGENLLSKLEIFFYTT